MNIEALASFAFTLRGIPCFYEKHKNIKSHDKNGVPRTLKPDFTAYINKKWYYFEILGKMNDEKYRIETEQEFSY